MCTNFCNGDGLLLHGFVDGHPVIFSHLGEEEGREGRGGEEEGKLS